MPEKFVQPDLAALADLVRDARVGHFAFVEDGQPHVLPIAIVADGADILLHGSSGSHWLRLLATGIPVALSVTAIDALVVARSAFESSMNYRSAVLFGHCAPIADTVPVKVAALDLVTDGLIPGRVAELRPHSASGRSRCPTAGRKMDRRMWRAKPGRASCPCAPGTPAPSRLPISPPASPSPSRCAHSSGTERGRSYSPT